MKVERKTIPGIPEYYIVQIDKDELRVSSGKTYPHSTWLGVINLDGRINAWTPVGYKPRGYLDAAYKILERVRQQLRSEGKVR